MIVVDASVLTNALTDDGPIGDVGRTELARDMHWAAPEHLIVEVFSAIRGRLLGRKITQDRARDALDTLEHAEIELLATTPVLARMWQLHERVSGYDAAYIAIAEAHGCVLITADARLERAGGIRCPMRIALPGS